MLFNSSSNKWLCVLHSLKGLHSSCALYCFVRVRFFVAVSTHIWSECCSQHNYRFKRETYDEVFCLFDVFAALAIGLKLRRSIKHIKSNNDWCPCATVFTIISNRVFLRVFFVRLYTKSIKRIGTITMKIAYNIARYAYAHAYIGIVWFGLKSVAKSLKIVNWIVTRYKRLNQTLEK